MSTAEQDLTPAPVSGAPRRGRGLLLGALLLPCTVAVSGLALWGTLASEAGSAWLLRQVPGLEVEGTQGSLLGDFSARSVRYRFPGSEDQLTLKNLQWQGLSLAWDPSPWLWARIELDRLSASRMELQLLPSSEPTPVPQDLRLPIAVRAKHLALAELSLPSLSATPLLGLEGSVGLGEDGGHQHRARIQALRWQAQTLSGEASVASSGTMQVSARLQLQQAQADGPGGRIPAWEARINADGPLLQLPLQVQLHSLGGAHPQALQADAVLAAFEAWPLRQARIHAQNLDLSQLHAGAPLTRLSGQLRLQAAQGQAPLSISAELDNTAAGRHDAQRLPIQHLRLALDFRPWDPSSLKLQQLHLLLGSTAQPAGTVTAQGSSLAQGSALQIQIEGLRPEALDQRLAPALAGGVLKLRSAAGMPALTAAPDSWAPLQLSLALQGRLAPELQAAEFRVQADSELRPHRLKLDQLQLLSGGGRLDAQGDVQWTQAWSATLQAQMSALDLRHFWRGEAGSAWRNSSQSLNASLQAKLQATDPRSPWPQAPQGQVKLLLQPSRLAGLPFSGELSYQRGSETVSGGVPQATASLDLAGNQWQAQWAAPDAQRLRLDTRWHAPELAALQPWLGSVQAGLSLQGDMDGTLGLEWRRVPAGPAPGVAPPWQLSSHAELSAKALQFSAPGMAPLRLRQSQLRWDLPGQPEAAMQARWQAGSVESGNRLTLRDLALDLSGLWGKHRLKLQAHSEFHLPAALLSAGQSAVQAGPLSLTLDGQFSQTPLLGWREGLQWHGRAIQLLARPDTAALPAWLSAEQLALHVDLGPHGGLEGLRAEPGRIELLGAAFTWRQLSLRALAASSPQAELDLTMEPLAVSQLLARWQPGFGWGGDLVMGGQARISSDASNLKLDVAVQRSAGDLSVTDERGTQALGLSELRFGLLADQGVWHLTQAMAGQNLGALGGAITARTAAPHLVPDRQTPLEGVLEARVANLGTWGGWVPTGWRLGGSLFASLSLGGRVGAPEVIGSAGGQGLALRNPLYGVDVQEGQFDLRLSGDRASLERFSARGGDGQLRAQGQVLLGAEPRAELKLEAERFALLRRVDRRLTLSGNSLVKLSRQGLDVNGSFAADDGLFDFTRGNAPQLDDDVLVLRPEDSQEDKPDTAAAPKLPVHVQLELDLGKKLRVRGRGLDTLLAGQLKLSQQNGKPNLQGVVSTVGGSFDAYAQKLEIERGQISFTGAIDNPRLDVLAIRPGLDDVRVGVTVTGTALNPRIKLYADPDMRDSDKLSWLVLGRAPESLGRGDTALLQRAAMALLSGEGESTTGKLMRNLGLDELSVHQDADEAKGTVVRLGKQLSKRVYVGYERGLNATTGSWQLIYRIAQRFTLRAQSGDDNALDFIWQWKWE